MNIKNQINSYPRNQSQYLRRQTQIEYIDGSLTLSEMYRMRADYCRKENI